MTVRIKNLCRVVAPIVLAVVALAPAQADELAHYSFGPPFTLSSSDTDPNSVASNFGPGSGLIGGPAFIVGDPPPAVFTTFNSIGGISTTSEAAAVVAEEYGGFSVMPDAGYQMDLFSLTFRSQADYQSLGFIPTFPFVGLVTDPSKTVHFFVRSSVDSFASTLDSWDQNEAGFLTRTVDLNTPPFQDLTSSVEFRIYMHDSGSDDALGLVRLDNVVLNGTVSNVPEPASMSLLAGGVLGLIGSRRRRRQPTA